MLRPPGRFAYPRLDDDDPILATRNDCTDNALTSGTPRQIDATVEIGGHVWNLKPEAHCLGPVSYIPDQGAGQLRCRNFDWFTLSEGIRQLAQRLNTAQGSVEGQPHMCSADAPGETGPGRVRKSCPYGLLSSRCTGE